MKPLIGFLGLPTKRRGRPVAGMDPDALRRIARQVERLGGQLIAFTLKGIDQEKAQVRGWRLQGGRWVRASGPLPQVIYERLINRRVERGARLTLAYLRSQGVKIFNTGYLDKGEIYELLLSDPAMARFLPETRPGDWNELPRFIERHELVYLKPRTSCKGHGIIRLERVGDQLTLYYRKGGQNQVETYPVAAGLARAQSLLRRTFIMQEGIDLIRLDGRLCDFRVMVTKDGRGEWQLTTIGAKQAEPGGITTHGTSGGRAIPVQPVLATLGSTQAAHAYTGLGEAAIEIAKFLERRLPPYVADLGFDFGVDRKGRVFLIEANSKCGTEVFGAAPGKTLWYDRIAAHAVYLAGGGGPD